MSKTHDIKNILVISLTSIGDVILTLPVVDILRHACPQAKITLTAGPKAAVLFRDNPLIDFVPYDKRALFSEKIRFVRRLREKSYDLVVDLRNTAIPFLVKTRCRTPLHRRRFTGVHIKDTHILRLQTVWKHPLPERPSKILMIPESDQSYVRELIRFSGGERIVALCPGAANVYKRWWEECFAELADRLVEEKQCRVVLLAGPGEEPLTLNIMKRVKYPQSVVDLAGRTDLLQTAQVFLDSAVVVANDSGPMHLASYLDVPTVGIFGYSDPAYARPWGRNGVAVRRNQDCAVCREEEARLSSARDKRHIARDGRGHTCIRAVQVQDVLCETLRFL